MDGHIEFAVGPETLTVRDVEPEDEAGLVSLLFACADWLEAATGLPPAEGDVQSLFYALPEGASYENKEILVVLRGDEPVGLVDAVRDHPGGGDCSVGLFLLHPRLRGQGVGAGLAEQLLRHAADGGVRRVIATNAEGWAPGLWFLERLGFEVDESPVTRDQVGNRSAGPREVAVRRAVLTLDR